MSSKSFFLILFLVFGAQANCFSQSIDELNKLDETAFAALEDNASDATKKANELLAAGQKANSPVHQINAYTILGIINKNKGYYITSVDFYNNALRVAEETKDDGRISACYNNIGSVYQIQENYEKALIYFKKSLEIEEKLKNPLQKSIRLYNIGEIYREMDSLSLALSNFNNSLIIEKEHKNDEGIVYALLGIADVYLQLDRPTDASISLEDAKQLVEESNIEVLILYYMLKGELHYRQGEYDEALSILRKAKDISKQHEFRVHLTDIYEKELKVKTAQEKSDLDQKKSDETEKPMSSNKLVWFLAIPLALLLGFIVYRSRLISKKKTNPSSGKNSEQNTNGGSSEEGTVFKLESDKGRTLIEVQLESVICFEANDNYVNIYYLIDESIPKKTMERISLKKIEEQLETLGMEFSRVHKSYLINPNRVEKIGGKAQAYRIKLEHLEKQVPVSRNFDISQFQA